MADRFSAGELESFAYCPLSWFLGSGQDSATASGVAEHAKLSKELSGARDYTDSAAVYGNVVIYYAAVSTVLLSVALSLLNFRGKHFLSVLLVALALLWIIMAVSMLWIRTIAGFRTVPDKLLLYFTCAAIVFAALSITVLNSNRFLSTLGMIASIVWLIGATVFLRLQLGAEYRVRDIYLKRRIPGRVVYFDDGNAPLLVSADGSLSGKPDIIVERNGSLYPVEFKSGRVPEGPLFSHIVQIAAYCKLVQDNYGMRPESGIIQYRGREFEVEYNKDMENLVQTKIKEMRGAIQAGSAHRNHNRPGKCLKCSRRSICPERLA